ncbi:MAG: hypothetical protein Q9214_005874 [Letrouitia sp. 1 TL-2023]
MVLQAIKYSRGKLEILDQLKLPHHEVYIQINSPEDARSAIQSMQVRGAPAIAIVAALSIAVKASAMLAGDLHYSSKSHGKRLLIDSWEPLLASRPTAVNLADAARKLNAITLAAFKKPYVNLASVLEAYIAAAEQMLEDDVQDNKSIGKYGAEWIIRRSGTESPREKISVITHCNTGSLATAGYGTALGVIRTLHAFGTLNQVYYTETRPYNQGSRLTGFELIHDGIPATLITDSMVGALLKTKRYKERISAIVVGADRVAANGDTANKIGTYTLAVLAHHHSISFLVAAPRTAIDLSIPTGESIVIEERPQNELTNIKGPTNTAMAYGSTDHATLGSMEIAIAAKDTKAWNPAFDVTPAELIDGIVTEKGVVEKDGNGTFHLEKLFNESDLVEPP